MDTCLKNIISKLGKWLNLPTDYQEHINEGLQGVPLPPELLDANWEECILYLVSGWDKSGTRLNRLHWPKNTVSGKDEITKVPGWDQFGTKLLHKKAVYFIQIMTLVSKAISLEGMMEAIGYKNRATFRNNYLDALESVGFVTKTIPDMPSSPDQKYILTESGKLFLGGYPER